MPKIWCSFGLLAFALCAASPACSVIDAATGDSESDDADAADSTDAAQVIDAGPDAGPDVDATPTSTAYAAGSDFSSAGTLMRIDLPGLDTMPNAVPGAVSPDPTIRYIDGRVYIVNRSVFQSVAIVDPETDSIVASIPTGAGTNPWDVAVKGNALYAAALGSPDLLVFDIENPLDAPGTISLAALDSVDGIPDCNSLYLVDPLLYVSCGVLDDSFQPRDKGKIAVINVNTSQHIGTFDLTYKNPIGLLRRAPESGDLGGDLLIPTTEDFGAGPGCIERINVQTSSLRGCLIENSALGGYAAVIQFANDKVYASVSGTPNKIFAISTSGVRDADPLTPAEHSALDFAICPTGEIVANDKAAEVVRVYDSEGVELTMTSTGIPLGLNPVWTNGITCF